MNEFYRVAFRKKVYTTLEGLQTGLDAWLGSTMSGGGITNWNEDELSP